MGTIKLIGVKDCLKINTHVSPKIDYLHEYAQLQIKIAFESEKIHGRLVQHLYMIFMHFRCHSGATVTPLASARSSFT